MRKIKWFSKLLAIISAVSILSLPVNADTTALPYVNNDYVTSSENFNYTFKELVEMSDEEFMTSDRYSGDVSTDSMPWHMGYNDICDVLDTFYLDVEQAENMLGLGSGTLVKHFDTDTVYKIAEAEEVGYVAVIPYYSGCSYTEDEIYDKKCILIKNLTNEFWINNTTDFINNTEENVYLNQKIDSVWLAKYLNEYFGDEISYKCYEELNWKTQKPTGRIKVKFDMEDKLLLTKENVIYSAKILNCLKKINYDAFIKVDRSMSEGEQTIESELFNSTVKVGDADNDGSVTVRDCAVIANKLSKQDNSFTEWIDYNLDTKINVRDSAAIAKDLASK